MVKIREEKYDKLDNVRKDILIYNLNCHDNPNKLLYVHNKNHVQHSYEDENIEDLNFTVII